MVYVMVSHNSDSAIGDFHPMSIRPCRAYTSGLEVDFKPAVLNSRNAYVNKVQRSFRLGRLSEGRA